MKLTLSERVRLHFHRPASVEGLGPVERQRVAEWCDAMSAWKSTGIGVPPAPPAAVVGTVVPTPPAPSWAAARRFARRAAAAMLALAGTGGLFGLGGCAAPVDELPTYAPAVECVRDGAYTCTLDGEDCLVVACDVCRAHGGDCEGGR